MNVTLFNQILQTLPRDSFQSLVNEHNSNKASKGIDSWTHLVSMLFCHFGQAGSVRDISNGLRSLKGNRSHLGIGKAPCKSSISYINKHRNWELFQDYFYSLLTHFDGQHHFQRVKLRRIKRKIFILDSTTISVCQSLFDWAKFRKRKGGLKLHTVLDYDGCLPVYGHISEAKKHDSQVARMIDFPSGSVVLFDRAYIDYQWMKDLDSRQITFVTRTKTNMDFKTEKVHFKGSRKDIIIKDSTIRLSGFYTEQYYSDPLRLVRFWDEEQQRELEFITNNFSWTAQTIADLYKERWNIETFFKNIKQRLKIKTFIGTSPNAVMIQIWTALICYLILSFLKAKAKYGWNLSNLVTFLRLNLLVKIDLWLWLNNPFDDPVPENHHQLNLFKNSAEDSNPKS